MSEFVKKKVCDIIGVDIRGRMESLVRNIRQSWEFTAKDIEGKRKNMNEQIDNFIEEVKSICNYVRDEINKELSEIELRWRIRSTEKEKYNISVLDSLIKEMHEKGE